MSVKIHGIWVGQGDCTMIHVTETNTLILIDCGTSDDFSIYEDNVKPSIEAVLTAAGKTSIDYLILTHSDKDHCNLIPKLLELSTLTAFDNFYHGGSLFQFEPYVYDKSTKSIHSKIKKTYDLVSHWTNLFVTETITTTDFTMWILAGNFPYKNSIPDTPFAEDINRPSNRKTKARRTIYDNNGNSLILAIEYKGFRAMLLGDATQVQQDHLVAVATNDGTLQYLAMPLLKLSHHGSPESFSTALASTAVKPTAVLASAGVTFGHPSEEKIKTITSVAGAAGHDLVLYDDAKKPNEYKTFNGDTRGVFNTMTSFQTSASKVPTKTPSGKKSRDPHAGEPYLELEGGNWTIESTGGTAVTFTGGTTKTILTTKGTMDVNAKAGSKRKR